MSASARRRTARLLFGIAAAAVVSLAPAARADDVSTAETLFREGRVLLEAHDYEHACPKLAESFRIDPSAGTLLNLARCHEEEGKTATAWTEYLAAERLARAQGKTAIADVAVDRAGAVRGKLVYVTVRVKAWVAGLEVRRDDVTLGEDAIGAPIPVDPGSHTLSASAPGHRPWSATFEPSPGGTRVEVPELVRETAPAPAPATALPLPPGSLSSGGQPAPSTAPPDEKRSPALGYAAGSFGLAALAVGSVFGALAIGDYNTADHLCPQHQGCGSDALAAHDRAETKAWVADVGIGIGVVGVGVAAYYLIFARPARSVTASAGGVRFEF
jgi:hypothetical protein